jgi:hypothetical protein
MIKHVPSTGRRGRAGVASNGSEEAVEVIGKLGADVPGLANDRPAVGSVSTQEEPIFHEILRPC